MSFPHRIYLGTASLCLFVAGLLTAADPIPHAQDKPPGPALSPAEAIAKMKVPEGFTVEVVASEPDLVNPIGMTFDEKGRIWVTESLEYPRRNPGPGKDRVKLLEDPDNDGKFDKVSIFAEGLNIPSGVAVGHGGVWVANAPDILFYPDANSDGVADGEPTVIVTGFGRTDTHELPNSLTWGPDGWLYGLNGVFNHSHVFYPKSSPHFREEHPGWKFTVALFRIHPVTREFQLFCEGTSNPWGVAFDGEGNAFISACVIDHLWHLVETGYYHRQGGPYPPFTWKIESIVKHKHQKAAYCGIHYFDSDAYPEQYRQKLYMGNIHGGCINVDTVKRTGSTFFGMLEPDFLTANDAWFMPVVQKTGPDGSLYVLDWYDRYHCYQDANRDPAGIDRLKGRLYRVRYQNTPRVKIYLAKESDKELIQRLDAGNDLIRGLAQRLLTERLLASKGNGTTSQQLTQLALDTKAPRRQRLHAMWTVASSAGLDDETLAKLLVSDDATFRAWGIRSAGNQGKVSDANRAKIISLASDPSPEVTLQVAIVSKKIAGIDPIPTLLAVLQHAQEDSLIPRIVWQNLHPLLETDAAKFTAAITEDVAKSPPVALLIPRAIDRILAVKTADPAALAGLFNLVTSGGNQNQDAGRNCLQTLAARVQNRELAGAQLAGLQAKLEQPLNAILANEKHPLRLEAALLAASWKNPAALTEMSRLAIDSKRPEPARLAAVEALVAAKDANIATMMVSLLQDTKQNSVIFRGQLLATAGRLEDDAVATSVLENFAALEPELKPRGVELLSQRVSWGKKLLAEVAAGKIAATMINVNQAQKLSSLGDEQLNALLAKHWRWEYEQSVPHAPPE
jgi:putative membrane-bound dehydrogenase-like protein